jgi:hypothetical protein
MTEENTYKITLHCDTSTPKSQKEIEKLRDLINAYYKSAGMSASLRQGKNLTVTINTSEANRIIKRGRHIKQATLEGNDSILLCGHVKALQDMGMSDKRIIEQLNISRATYYRKMKAFKQHRDLSQPF